MVKHIDLFEKICGQMAHNRPHEPPTEEQKIDWFLDTVNERTYDSIHASCVNQHIEGTLTFAKLVKLYTHQCFQRYPHFQLTEIDPKVNLSNNSNHLHKGGRKGKGKKGNNDNRGQRDKMQGQTRNNTNPNPTQHKGSGKKGKGKGKNNNQGNRKPKEPCNYCGIPGHSARDCRRRQREEKEKQDNNEKRTKEVKNHVLIADETDLMFTQHVVYADKIKEEENQKPMRTSANLSRTTQR